MKNFRHIEPSELVDNPIKLIGEDWMLVTSANTEGPLTCGKDYNTMTASWGGVGVLWGRPVVFVFIRPQRHTFEFTEANDRLTLTFYPETYRKTLSYCGKYSGREVDKAKECGLTPVFDVNKDGRAVWFNEARLVIKAKKLYADVIKRDAFTDDAPLANYSNNDFHTMYVCEITEVLAAD